MAQLNVSKTDVDTKVERILKMVRRKNRGKTELVGLIEDIQKQYQSLYAQYDHLKRGGGSGKEGAEGTVNESSSNHAHNSDSEYYSSEDVEINTALGHNRHACRKRSMDMEDEVRKAYGQIADLKHQLACTTKEKEALDLCHQDALSRIQEIETMNGDLRNKMDETEKGHFALEEQLADLKTELEFQHNQTRELEILVQSKSKEISQYLVQVKTLTEELARKSAAEQIMVEEKQRLQVQVMDLESEVDVLSKEKNRSEEEVKSNVVEISQLREEKGKLNERILELETLYRKTGNDTGTGIGTGTNISMPPKTKLVRRLSLGNNFNFHCLERKMEDLAIEVRKKVDDSIRMLYQRVKVVERIQYENTELYTSTKRGLVKEIESLKHEVATIEEEYDVLRQEVVMLDAGNEALKREVNMLEAGNEALKQEVATLEAELKKLRYIAESDKNTSIGLNSMVEKLEDERNFLTPISIVTDEECETRVEEAKSNVDDLVAEIQKENEQELLREKVMNLEAKLSEEGEEKLKVLKAMRGVEEKMRDMQKEIFSLEAKLIEEGKEKLKVLKAMSEVEEKMREMQRENERLLREKVEAKLNDEGAEKLKVLKAMREVEEKMKEMQKENEKLLREKVKNFEAKLREEGEEKVRVLKAMREVEEKMREMQKENEKLLREEVLKFEAKLSTEREEKLNLLKAMREVETRVRELEKISKEKDENLLVREEEKREAIRQLCLLIDYHRTCCEHLKQSISTLTLRLKIKTKT